MKSLNSLFPFLPGAFSMILFYAGGGCQKPIELDIPAPETTTYVVEGYIEHGAPPVIFLTRTLPFYDTITPERIAQMFVHNAEVRITVDGTSYPLKEVSSDTLSGIFQQVLALFVPTTGTAGSGGGSSSFPPLYFYTIRNFSSPELLGQAGKRYDLEIRIPEDGTVLRASTWIPPQPPPLDTFWWTYPSDTMALLWAQFTDPPRPNQYYRYQTRVRGEPFCNPIGNVVEDRYFNGGSLTIQVERGICNIYESGAFNPDTYGQFYAGDSVWVRWCEIDPAQYRFLLQMGYAISALSNPFAGPTAIDGNIEGGFGIWGGLHCRYYSIYIPLP